jgi:purine-binding chemotaxis protein CheW
MTSELSKVKSEIKNHSNDESGVARSKYLVFDLMEERYGVPLSSVKEVIGLTEITQVPNVPTFFKGLINLRGKIISIIDLRSKLQLQTADYKDKKTTIIIAEIDGFTIGTIVDDVKEVANFENSQIEHGLDIQSNTGREFLTGVAKTEDKGLTLLLDIGKVLSVDELKIVKEQSRSQQAA